MLEVYIIHDYSGRRTATVKPDRKTHDDGSVNAYTNFCVNSPVSLHLCLSQKFNQFQILRKGLWWPIKTRSKLQAEVTTSSEDVIWEHWRIPKIVVCHLTDSYGTLLSWVYAAAFPLQCVWYWWTFHCNWEVEFAAWLGLHLSRTKHFLPNWELTNY